jgi:hypothetical protein
LTVWALDTNPPTSRKISGLRCNEVSPIGFDETGTLMAVAVVGSTSRGVPDHVQLIALADERRMGLIREGSQIKSLAMSRAKNLLLIGGSSPFSLWDLRPKGGLRLHDKFRAPDMAFV